MRYPADHKDRVRKQIIRAASRRFRGRGSEGVPITELMQDLELTHGGFYRHFDGKEELFGEALIEGFAEAEARMTAAIEGAPAGRELEAIIHKYLSLEHCADPAGGCPIAALTTEIARHPRKTRSKFFRALQSHAPTLLRFMPGRTLAERQRGAMVLFAGMAGVVNLARATPDEASRRRILEGACAFYVRAVRH
jgi:TetR/AcrR family transcriptional regulator, transcriptional repressor for nem operon